MPSIEGITSIQINTPTISRNEFGPNDRLETVQNLDEFLFNDYLEIDMGTLKDEERQFMVVDKDSGRVFDIRNIKHEKYLERLSTSEYKK